MSTTTTTTTVDLATVFEKDGFVGPIDILSRTEAKEILDEFMKWQKTIKNEDNNDNNNKTSNNNSNSIHLIGDIRFKVHLFIPWINKLVHHPKLINVVQDVLQSKNILCWSSDFNIKDPYTKQYYSPHQDSTYAGLQPSKHVLTAWIALSDPVSEFEGCLCFWKGSHKSGQLPHEESLSDEDNKLSRGQHCKIQEDWGEPVHVELRGGQASLHSFYTVHQSGPNQSSLPRIGLAIRYMTADVRQTGPTKESVTLISGRMVHDGFDIETILPSEPTAQQIKEAMLVHKEAVRRETANYFHSCQTMNTYDEKSSI